jgi:hypothetical protein
MNFGITQASVKNAIRWELYDHRSRPEGHSQMWCEAAGGGQLGQGNQPEVTLSCQISDIFETITCVFGEGLR